MHFKHALCARFYLAAVWVYVSKLTRVTLWNANECSQFFFFLTFFCHQHLTCLIFCSSPWRLCGPPPGPPSQFCPVVRSRLFSIRCLSSETCTKASTLAWRPGWASTVRLSPALLRRERWATQAFSWWWGTCFWKWWVLYCVACILCHGTIGNPLRNDGKERFSHGSTTRGKSFSLRCRKEVTA